MYPFWVTLHSRTSEVHQKLLRIQKPRIASKSAIFLNSKDTAHARTPLLNLLYNFACIPFGLRLLRTWLKCIRNYIADPKNPKRFKIRTFLSKCYCACANPTTIHVMQFFMYSFQVMPFSHTSKVHQKPKNASKIAIFSNSKAAVHA